MITKQFYQTNQNNNVKAIRQKHKRFERSYNKQSRISKLYKKESSNDVRIVQVRQYQKNKLMIPAPLEINRKSSVFVVKEGKKQYKLQKLTNSLNKQTYKLNTKHDQNTQELMTKKMREYVEKKNREIGESMSKEKQSMSEVVYNYSKYRSMQNQYKWNEKSKRKIDKRYSNQKVDEFVKFPQLVKNSQEIFTIDYDHEGKKMVKVNLNQLEFQKHEKHNSSILNKDTKSLSRDITKIFTEKQFTRKNQLHLIKRKKNGNDFGIEIKSINNKLVESNQYDTGLELRRQLYEIVTEEHPKKNKFTKLKEENDSIFDKLLYQSKNDAKSSSGLMDLKFISTKQLFATNSFKNHKYKFSSSSLSFHKSQGDELQSKVQAQIHDEVVEKEEDIKEKQRPSQISIKREPNKKSIVYFEKEMTVYDQKMCNFKEFLFMMNLVHKKFDFLTLGEAGSLKNEQKYRYFIGYGNNKLLVQSLMKRRFWWVPEEDYRKAHFSWTQLKINPIFQMQRKSQVYCLDCKPDEIVEDRKKKKHQKKDTEVKSPTRNNIFFKAPFPPEKDKILTSYDKKIFESLENNISAPETNEKLSKFCNKLKHWQGNPFSLVKEERINEKMHNHLEFNHFIGNKKALFYNLKQYYDLRHKDVFEVIPLTYHVKEGTQDPQYLAFAKEFRRLDMLKHQYRKKKQKQKMKKGKQKQKEDEDEKIKNLWIVKPGQNSNRGNGIVVVNELYSFISILRRQEKHSDGNLKTYIIQRYIQNPLLYKGRKFDIRHYMIITRVHGIMRAYWYGQGYIRTASEIFDLDDIGDEMVHLTNDAIQKNSTFYGKHEEGNKLSYNQFQKYLDQKYGQEKISFADHIYPKMKSIATDTIKSTYLKLDSNNMEHNFQIFGLDFMIDQKYNVWLIQVNTNPCLEISGKLLSRIIPNMLEHAFRLSIDVIFPPPTHYPNSQKYLAPDNTLGRLMYQLIFDEARDGKELVDLYRNSSQIDYGGEVKEDDEVYENDGKQIQLATQLN